MTFNQRSIVLGLGGVLTLVALGSYLVSGSSSELETTPDPLLKPKQALTKAPLQAPHVWSAGVFERSPPRLDGEYAISYETTLEPQGAARKMRIAFEGKLNITAGGELWSEGAVSDVTVELDAQARAQLTDLPAAYLGEVFAPQLRVEHDARGRLLHVLYTQSSPQSVRSTWLGLLSSVQLVSPVSPLTAPLTTWSGLEEDANTQLQATYTLTDVQDVRKRWENIVEPNQPKLYTANGEAHFKLSASASHIISVRSEQTAFIDVTGSGQQRLKVYTLVSLRRVGAAAAVALSDADSMQPYDAAKHLPSTPEQLDQRMVAGRTFEQLDDTLKQHSAANAWQLRAATRRDLAAYMRLNPEAVHVVADKLERGVELEPLRRSYVEALASVSTEESQQRLASLSSNRELPEALRMQTTQVMALTGQPSEALVLSLLTLSASDHPADKALANTALVSAGAAAHNLREVHKTQGDAIIADLVGKADKFISTEALGRELGMGSDGHTEQRLVAWLSALGNTESEEILPTLVRATNAKSAWIRQTAYHAMRSLPGEEVGQLVSDAILQDPHVSVRRDALKTAKVLGVSRCLAATKRALLNDERALVRMEAANTLGAWLIHEPSLAEIFEAALANEREDYIRDAMRNYMRPDPRLQASPNPPLP